MSQFAQATFLALLLGLSPLLIAKVLAQPEKPAPAVIVAPVVSKVVAESAEFVGQTEAIQSVDIRARVTGFLLERPFKEGSNVKKGDVLFVIDPSEFNAARDVAKAKFERAEAAIDESERQLARYSTLTARGTTSEAALDEAKTKAGQAKADLAAAKADLERAKLDLEWSRIVSPMDGRIGGSTVDVGNLIGPDSGVLATVVALDPVRVTFSVSERDYLNYKEAIQKGEVKGLTPKIRLANGKEYPHDGEIDYVDNRVDPTTGTIKVRVHFPNPDALILPGLFVNLTLVNTEPKKQLVIPQAAVQENQAGSFVLVVDDDNKVEQRPIKTGQRLGTELVVTEGLTEGETIIVEGIQKVRPGAEVKPVMQQQSAAAQ